MENFIGTGAISTAADAAETQGTPPVPPTAVGETADKEGTPVGGTDTAGSVGDGGAGDTVGVPTGVGNGGPSGAGETGETRGADGTASENADGDGVTDYAALAADDLRRIKRMAPSLAGLTHLAELPNALRYAALRDAGLSVEEALYAACHAFVTPQAADNRAHLRSAVPIGAAGTPSRMTAAEMREARELFGDLTEGEIERLYARCQPD